MSLAPARLCSGLGASTSKVKQSPTFHPLLAKPRSIACASSGRPSTSTSGSFDFDEAARTAKSKWESFAREQELEKKANQAMKKGGEVFEQVRQVGSDLWGTAGARTHSAYGPHTAVTVLVAVHSPSSTATWIESAVGTAHLQ